MALRGRKGDPQPELFPLSADEEDEEEEEEEDESPVVSEDEDDEDDREEFEEEPEEEELNVSGTEEKEREEEEEEEEEGDVALLRRGFKFDGTPPQHTSQPTKHKAILVDEEGEDSSEDERQRNRVGNVPMRWYKDFDHIGYDVEGEKLLRKHRPGEVDQFLASRDDPNYWRTIYDEVNDETITLTDPELNSILRIVKGKYADPTYDPYEPWVDLFDWPEGKLHPLSSAPEPKRRFVPSKWEAKQVVKLVRAIRKGWLKPRTEEAKKPDAYLLWQEDDQAAPKSWRTRMHIPAPKTKPPGHAESYNPPVEYLPTEPGDRTRPFLPTRYDALRKVPFYENFVKERFERCLDLYLCPRVKKIRLRIDPDTLLPKLPKSRELEPFPKEEFLQYHGHSGKVRCISVDPTGHWLLSGADDLTVRLWEVHTGRSFRTWTVHDTVHAIAWNPNPMLSMAAVAIGATLFLFDPGVASPEKTLATEAILCPEEPPDREKKASPRWSKPSKDLAQQGFHVAIPHYKPIKQVVWHIKGDYMATVCPEATTQAVMVHQVSKRASQNPFRRAKGGQVQRVLFHPTKPFFFVATQRFIRVYHLVKQELVKKLLSGVKWISSLDIHPGGDNLVVGSYDKRLCWFDMDLSSKPYKILRYHKFAIRQVAFHKHYPLFASCSDDGNIHVFHGMVYNDLLQNALIVPVKILRGHTMTDDLGVLDCTFHPSQPWIFSCGADQTIRLWC